MAFRMVKDLAHLGLLSSDRTFAPFVAPLSGNNPERASPYFRERVHSTMCFHSQGLDFHLNREFRVKFAVPNLHISCPIVA